MVAIGLAAAASGDSGGGGGGGSGGGAVSPAATGDGAVAVAVTVSVAVGAAVDVLILVGGPAAVRIPVGADNRIGWGAAGGGGRDGVEEADEFLHQALLRHDDLPVARHAGRHVHEDVDNSLDDLGAGRDDAGL